MIRWDLLGHGCSSPDLSLLDRARGGGDDRECWAGGLGEDQLQPHTPCVSDRLGGGIAA